MSRAKVAYKRILVTGGAGFIGSHVVDALLLNPRIERVVVIDNFDTNYDPALKEDNIRAHRKDARYRLVRGDIRDASILEKLFKKEQFDAIIHLAAKADARKAVEDAHPYLETNIMGSYNLLECAKRFGVKKLVLASTSAVYGNANRAPYREDAKTDFPLTAYGATKKAMEQLAYTFHHNFGLHIVCVRIFNAYGERMRPDLVLPKWVAALRAGEPIKLSGKGIRRRDYTYVGDLARAIMSALNKDIAFDIINVGSSKPVSLRSLLTVVERTLGKKAQIIEVPSHPGSVERTHASTTKAKEVLGWEPHVGIEEGVRRYVAWLSDRTK